MTTGCIVSSSRACLSWISSPYHNKYHNLANNGQDDPLGYAFLLFCFFFLFVARIEPDLVSHHHYLVIHPNKLGRSLHGVCARKVEQLARWAQAKLESKARATPAYHPGR